MVIPHQFISLVEGPVQAVIIAGTGLSAPTCPTLKELKKNLDNVAVNLGITPHDDEYKLAGEILEKLKSGGSTDAQSRLYLVEQLGMLDDRRWFGEVGVPLSGNTPRHRALARFVIEERLRAIVSLNWDALLEAGLDSVGLKEGSSTPRPWKVTKYARVVDETHMPLIGQANVFPVLKPHGCVRDLESMKKTAQSGGSLGKVTFKFTSDEMKKIETDQEDIVDSRVNTYISECPLIGIGWRASEDYLRNAIVRIAKKAKRTEIDSFTVVNRRWYPEHSEIASSYNKNKSESFAQVSIGASPSTDCLFQWLQARHAIKKMIDMSEGADQAALKEILVDLEFPDCDHPVLNWADYWLPSWVRICWRAGAVRGVDPQTNKIIGPCEIPVTPRDAHIPLTGMSVERHDLRAATKLLLVLTASFNNLRFDLYPGGIFDADKQLLYIPLPGWKVSDQHSDLAALKPLVEALKSLGYVRKIFLVLINDQNDTSDTVIQTQLEAQFRSLMPHAGFAQEKGVSWVDLKELKVQ